MSSGHRHQISDAEYRRMTGQKPRGPKTPKKKAKWLRCAKCGGGITLRYVFDGPPSDDETKNTGRMECYPGCHVATVQFVRR